MMWPPLNAVLRSALVLGLLLGTTTPVSSAREGEARTAKEYELKAAFLYNLAKFVKWPADRSPAGDPPFVIGVYGAEAYNDFARTLEGKPVGRRNVVVRQCTRPEEAKSCQIVFVARSVASAESEIVKAAQAEAVLSLGESEKFLEQGGMIRFYLEQGQLRLEIDGQRIRSAGLSIMSNALSTLVGKGIAKLRNP